MRRVIVIGNLTWSVYRVDKGVEKALKDRYVYKFYDFKGFYLEEVLADIRNSDVVVIDFYLHDELMTVIKKDEDLRKVCLVCHGDSELVNNRVKPCELFTLGVVSPVLIPKMNKIVDRPIYLTPNGVDPDEFIYRERSGIIETIGWCGSPTTFLTKRSNWAVKIAQKSKLALNYAMTVPYEDIKDWYHTIDILIVTAGPNIEAESGPLPPFEAIVSGIPVIGTVVGNLSFIPGPKFSTIDEAVAILEHLKTDPTEVKRLANEQLEYVFNNFTYKALKPHWEKMFDAVVEANEKYLES